MNSTSLGMPKSGAPIQTPSSVALIALTPIKGHPMYVENSHCAAKELHGLHTHLVHRRAGRSEEDGPTAVSDSSPARLTSQHPPTTL